MEESGVFEGDNGFTVGSCQLEVICKGIALVNSDGLFHPSQSLLRLGFKYHEAHRFPYCFECVESKDS